jgi:hypothetical protein
MNKSAPMWRISLKFDIAVFYENPYEKLNFH